MPETTLRQRPERAAVYWRRRVAVLVLSMSLLAALTWSGAALLSGRGRPGNAATGRPRLPAASAGRASSPGAASPAVRNDAAAYSGLAVPVRQAGRSCPVGDVAMTLSATKGNYAALQQPEFAINVVSVASYSCSFDIGAAHVLLQISAGQAQVWTSADCAEGLASQLVTLRRSVPAVLTMTWDEQYSSSGCPVPGRTAPAGSYTARATDGSAISDGVTFTVS